MNDKRKHKAMGLDVPVGAGFKPARIETEVERAGLKPAPTKDLPEGWGWKTLGEACTVILGQSPESITYNTEKNGLPFFQGKAEFGTRYPTIVKWCSHPKKVARKDDILISVRAPVGPTNLAPSECCIGRGLAAVRPSKDSDYRYVLYYLRSVEHRLSEMGTGTTFKAISGDTLRSIEIPLAPLDQQKLIVSEIEKQFSRLDEAVAALKCIKANLKRYKASVLKAAVEGKLTEEWRRLRIKKGKTSPSKGLTEGWNYSILDDLSLKVTDGEHLRPKTASSGIPFLSAKDIRDHGVTFDNVLYVREDDAEKFRKRCNPERGDILVVSRGATVGRSCIVNTDKIFCLLGSVILIKSKASILSKFLSYALKSPNIQKQLIALSGSTAQQAIYIRDIKKTIVSLPPLDEQQRIVEEIESRLSLAEEIEAVIETNLKRAERLRQAILKKAFSGELVPNSKRQMKFSLLSKGVMP